MHFQKNHQSCGKEIEAHPKLEKNFRTKAAKEKEKVKTIHGDKGL